MGLTPKQLEYFTAFVTGKYEYLLYGGAVGGGKTFLTLGMLDEFCQKFPGTRYAVVRKSLTSLRRNTLPSFRKILKINGDPERAKLHKGDWTYYYKNGSEIIFIEADVSTDPELYKLKGLEVTGVLMEEANEMDEKVFEVLITRIGRWYNAEYGIRQFIMLTCNPSDNWVKYKFYDQWSIGALKEPFYFLQALPQDNTHNTAQYLKGLENLSPAEYERYAKGNWNFSRDPNQLVPFAWYKECIRLEADEDTTRVPKYLGIDVAREGGDYSTLAFYDDYGLLWIERYQYDTCNPLRDIVLKRKAEFRMQSTNIMADGIGLGASLIDLCIEKGVYIEVFKSSEKADGRDTGLESFSFANKRAEAFWVFRQSIERNEITVPNEYELQKQIMVLRYMEEDKCIKIEGKKYMKKRLGYSPDTAEAAIIGNYLRVLRTKMFGLTENYVSRAQGSILAISNDAIATTLSSRELVY